MGTRSLTIFLGDDGKDLTVMYRQFDGYPDVHGKELLEWGQGRHLVNGYTVKDEQERAWNGMGCLAADCIMHFKKAALGPVGSIYVYPPGSRGEEFEYTLSKKMVENVVSSADSFKERGKLWLRVDSLRDSILFEGWLDDFDPEKATRSGVSGDF